MNGAAVEDQNPALSLLHLKVKVGDVHGQEVAVAPVEMYFFYYDFVLSGKKAPTSIFVHKSIKIFYISEKVRQFWYSLIFTEMSSIFQLFGLRHRHF